MNEDDLKKLWRQQPLNVPPPLAGAGQIRDIEQKMKRFDRIIKWRDVRELAACAVVAVAFGGLFVGVHPPVARLGCAITVAGAFFIAWRLVSSKRKAGPEIPGAPVMEALRREILKVDIQISLLRSVWWWYLLPTLGGASIFALGVQPDPRKRIVMLAAFLFAGVVVHWVNQRAVRQYLVPLKTELESMIGSSSQTDKTK